MFNNYIIVLFLTMMENDMELNIIRELESATDKIICLYDMYDKNIENKNIGNNDKEELIVKYFDTVIRGELNEYDLNLFVEKLCFVEFIELKNRKLFVAWEKYIINTYSGLYACQFMEHLKNKFMKNNTLHSENTICTFMKNLLSINVFRNNINYLNKNLTGKKFEQIGLFSLFHIMTRNVENIIDTGLKINSMKNFISSISVLWEKTMSCETLIEYIWKNIYVNRYYTYENEDSCIENDCSSVPYSMFIINILIEICKKYNEDINLHRIDVEKKITEFDITKTHIFIEKLYITFMYAFYVFYTFVIKKSVELNKIKMRIKDQGRLINMTYDSIINIYKTVVDATDNNYILKMICLYRKYYKLMQDDQLISSFISFIEHYKIINEYTKFSKEVFLMIEEIIKGKYYNNIHVKNNALIYYVKTYATNKNNFSESMYKTIVEYITQTDLLKSVHYNAEKSIYISGIVNILIKAYDKKSNINNDLGVKLMYKIFNWVLELFSVTDDLKQLIKEHGTIELNEQNIVFLKGFFSTIPNTFLFYSMMDKNVIKTRESGLSQLLAIIIFKVMDFCYENEENLSVRLLPYESDQAISPLSQTGYQRFDELMCSYVVNCLNNKQIDDEIFEILDQKNESLMEWIKLTYDNADDINDVSNKLKQKQKNKKNIVFPDKFIDPILCSVIKDPVMIPNVDLIFDRSTINMQINKSSVNPYTREPLTMDIVNEYNLSDDVKQKIKKFQDELNEFICNN